MGEKMTPALDDKLRCLQSLLQQMGASVACKTVGEARDALLTAHLTQPAQAVESDPQPLATGPTKWRAEHCVTHHHACDCREWEHACELHKWQGIAELSHGEMADRLDRAETLLRDIKAWDVGSFQDRKTLFALPLAIRTRITAHLSENSRVP